MAGSIECFLIDQSAVERIFSSGQSMIRSLKRPNRVSSEAVLANRDEVIVVEKRMNEVLPGQSPGSVRGRN